MSTFGGRFKISSKLLVFLIGCLSNTITLYASTNEESLERAIQGLMQKEMSIKALSLNFTMQMSKETEAIQRILKQRLPSEDVRTSKTRQGFYAPKEYLWQMKGQKMRLERKEGSGKEPRLLGCYDGEKFLLFLYYYEDIVGGQESALKSSRFKPGSLVQVHMYPKPTALSDAYVGDLYVPLNYLGLGINKERWGELLKDCQVTLIGIEKVGESSCYVIELKRQEEMFSGSNGKVVYNWRWRLWVDPKIGWSVRRRVDYSQEDRTVYMLEFEEYKCFANNIWLPTKSTATLFAYDEEAKKSVLVSKKVFSTKECKVNEEIQDEVFSPRIPDGVLVWDSLTNETYISGEKQPTDVDILEIADIARQFMQGTLKATDIEKNFGPQKGKTSIKFCGPNALLAVCGILGVKTSSQEIAKLAGTDQKGNTSMAGLKRAAEALGLKAEAMDLTLDELRQTKKLAIAWLPPGHYIVVVGFADDKVVIIDPPTVLAVVPISGLDNLWDGRVLLISKP